MLDKKLTNSLKNGRVIQSKDDHLRHAVLLFKN